MPSAGPWKEEKSLMTKQIIHTKYRLQLGNPFRGYGIARIILALIVGFIGLIAFQSLGPSAEWRGILRELGTMANEAEGRLSYGIHVVFTLVFGSVAIVSSIAYLLAGSKYMARLYLPAKVPDDFRDPKLLSRSIRKREILTYRAAPTASLRFLRTFFSEGVEFIPTSFRPIVSKNTRYIPLAMIPIILILVVSSMRGNLQQLLGTEIGHLPFPTGWLVAVLIIGIYRLVLAVMLIPRDVPSADFHHTNQTLGGAGHPETFLAELELKGDSFRYMDIPNRTYNRDDIELESDGMSDSGKIKGGILIETQPIPEQQTHRLPGYMLLSAGCLCITVGLSLLCFLPFDLRMLQFDQFALLQLPETIFRVIVGLVLLRNGKRFVKEAKVVLGRMLFSSDVFDIEFSGTFYKAEIGAGMSVDDSLRSTSTAIRSEVIVRYYAARCLSESVGFGRRKLLETQVPPELGERVTILKKALEEHQERGAKLVGIDFKGSEAIGEIASANVSLHATKAAAATQAKETGILPDVKQDDHLLPQGNEANPEDMKECPECAEMVRRKAKKCRYCGFRFSEP